MEWRPKGSDKCRQLRRCETGHAEKRCSRCAIWVKTQIKTDGNVECQPGWEAAEPLVLCQPCQKLPRSGRLCQGGVGTLAGSSTDSDATIRRPGNAGHELQLAQCGDAFAFACRTSCHRYICTDHFIAILLQSSPLHLVTTLRPHRGDCGVPPNILLGCADSSRSTKARIECLQYLPTQD